MFTKQPIFYIYVYENLDQSKIGKESETCYGKDSATQGNPRIFFVSLEIFDDVLRIYCFDYGWVEREEIVDANGSNKEEPHTYYWSEGVADFVCSKSLECE